MEELDLLKKDWKRNQDNFPAVSEKDIYAMLHKKSSSIVRWILIISAIEFVFWLLLSFLLKDSPNNKHIDSFHMDYIMIPMNILNYAIIIYFFCLFYSNYKKITTTDDVKTLMASILKTRKTVSNYIMVNMAYVILCTILLFAVYFTKDAAIINAVNRYEADGHLMSFYLIYIVIAIITIGIMLLLIWGFYKLVYGFLLRRLHNNYKELKKIDL